MGAMQRVATPLLVVALAGCGGGSDEGSTATGNATLVVGVSADPELAPRLGHVTVRAETPDGPRDAVWEKGAPLPLELTLAGLPEGATIEVTAVGEDDAGNALVTRSARTLATGGEPQLLRVRLNDECIAEQQERDISCPGQTCVGGLCADPYVSPKKLEVYRADWALPPIDPCAPTPDAPPVVTIGHDQEPFAPLAAGTVLEPQRGAQGGTHVWIALRMQGLAGDAKTFVWGDFPAAGEGSVAQYTIPYAPVDGACEVHSLRYVLPMFNAFDHPFRLSATLIDATGNAGHSHLDLVLSHPPP